MFEFAQTNLQLYRQMEQRGYSLEERERVAQAYRFLVPVFSGMYRGSEKPFIAHLVGTASILVAYRASIELVLAGLLHAVYMAGDFGFQPGRRQTTRKQRKIAHLAGEKAEEIIAVYDSIQWSAVALNEYHATFDRQPEPVRAAITLNLANTLEDLLDSGANYCSGSKLQTLSSPELHQSLLTMARAHSWPGLADRLAQALDDLNAGTTPVDPGRFIGSSRLVLPPSAHRKFLPTVTGWVVRRLRRAKIGGV